LGAADDFFAPAESKREEEATMAVKPVPEGHHTLVPHLALKDCAKAIEFYKAAFGARENSRLSMPDGKIIHADLTIGDSHVFLMDEPPGAPSTPPAGTIVHMWSPEPDAVFERASKAGAKVTMPLQDMFWGDRYGQLVDPFGHMWSVAKHLEDLSPDEIKKRAMKVYAEMKKGSPGR
jgi:uncharacterized glyoxalase superfamily protein PhnB